MDRGGAVSEAVNAIRQGRVEGLQDLIRMYELPALRLAFSITGDRELAEEVVSEAFMRLWKGASSYHPDRPFGPWFYRIVTNRAVAAVRHSMRWKLGGLLPSPAKDAADPGPGPEELAIRRHERSRIAAAVKLLPPEQRAAIFLRYYLDLSEPQIAEVLGWPLGSVKSRLHLARARLKHQLLPEAGERSSCQAQGGIS